MPSLGPATHVSGVVSPVEKKRRLRSTVILASFVALFGAGLVVYGVAWGAQPEGDRWLARRLEMVRTQLVARGVDDPRVLEAMKTVPRHEFVPVSRRAVAYGDHPVSIGHGQTISQPYIVAAMTELLDPQPDDVIFEVGTGSGYQAAVLSRLVKKVYTVEYVPALAERAQQALRRVGALNVEVRAGDGYFGDPAHAPFDGIIVTAAPETVPAPLVEQLAVGGRLVIPEGSVDQELVVYEKQADGTLKRTKVFDVRFVPMRGQVEKTSTST